jgi:hypothetical protein
MVLLHGRTSRTLAIIARLRRHNRAITDSAEMDVAEGKVKLAGQRKTRRPSDPAAVCPKPAHGVPDVQSESDLSQSSHPTKPVRFVKYK